MFSFRSLINLKFYIYCLFALWRQRPGLLFTSIPSTAQHTTGTQLLFDQMTKHFPQNQTRLVILGVGGE